MPSAGSDVSAPFGPKQLSFAAVAPVICGVDEHVMSVSGVLVMVVVSRAGFEEERARASPGNLGRIGLQDRVVGA